MNPGETRSKNIPVYLAILCVVFLASLPTFAAIWNKPLTTEWTGILSRNTSDLNIYISLIEQTRSGAYLCKNLFTPEPHDPFILRPVYLLLGLLGRLSSSLSPVGLIEAGRLGAGLTMLFVFAAVTRKLFKQSWKAAGVILILSLGSGVGWLSLVKDPPDLRIVETSTFLNFLSPPHFCMALVFVLLLFLLLDSGIAKPVSNHNLIRRTGILLGALWIGLEFPFVLFNVGVAMLAVLLLDGLKERNFPMSTFSHFLPAMIGMAIAGGFYVYLTSVSPMMEIYTRQFLVLSPEPLRLLSSGGLLIPLAIFGIRPIWKISYRFAAMILAYAITGTILAYAPVPYQERFLLGVPACLALFAASGWVRVYEHLNPGPLRLVIAIFILLLLLPSGLIGLRQDLTILQERGAPQYLPKTFLQGVQEVKNLPPDQAIFSAELSGNFIAGRSCRPVVIGQFVLTTDMQRKRSMVEFFCRKNAADPAAKQILEESGAKWLFWGPPEISLARNGFNPEEAPYLTRAFSNKVVSIYHIDR